MMQIPAYHFFGYFLNREGNDRLQRMAEGMGWQLNPHYKRITSLDEIGSIDGLTTPEDTETSWRQRWLDFINKGLG